jgi:hypothetical protein
MAYETRELRLKITGDTADVDKALAKTSEGAKRGGDSIKEFAAKAGPALLAVGAAAATLGIAAAKASFDQVDAVQQATVALGAYEKDASKVNSVLADLLKYARSDMGILFNRKDLFAAAQSLKTMGDNTENLTEHVKIMSRSVGLGLSTWDELSEIVGRVGSTSRLTGDDFDNLTKAGYKLEPALRNTDITFDSLFKALDKGIPTDAMAGQANTIKGLGIRFESAFRGIGDAILGVDSDTSKFVEGGLGDRLTKGIAAFTVILKDAKKPIADTIRSIQELADKIGSYFGPILQQIGMLIVTAFKPAFDSVKKAIDDVNQVFKDAGINIDVAKVMMAALTGVIVLSFAPIAALIGLIAGLAIAIAKVIQFFAEATSWAIRFTREAWINIFNFSVAVVRKFEEIRNGIVMVFAGIGNAIIGPFRGAFNFIVDAWNNTVGRLSFSVPKWVPGIGGNSIAAPRLSHFATGGIVPGMASQGDNTLIAATPGEMVLNKSQQQNLFNALNNGNASSSSVTLNVNIGMYAGMPVEKREIALELYKELVRAARSQGVQLPMIGAVGVQ